MQQNVIQSEAKSKFLESLWLCLLTSASTKTGFIFSLGPSHDDISAKFLKLRFNFFCFCLNMELFQERLFVHEKRTFFCVSELQKSIPSTCSESEIGASSLGNCAMSRILWKPKSNNGLSFWLSWSFSEKKLGF